MSPPKLPLWTLPLSPLAGGALAYLFYRATAERLPAIAYVVAALLLATLACAVILVRNIDTMQKAETNPC